MARFKCEASVKWGSDVKVGRAGTYGVTAIYHFRYVRFWQCPIWLRWQGSRWPFLCAIWNVVFDALPGLIFDPHVAKPVVFGSNGHRSLYHGVGGATAPEQ